MKTTPNSELREKLAAIEHERWASWQQWMHDQAKRDWDADGFAIYSFTLDQIGRWQQQIETEYKDLTDKEKASDMEQVDRYWPLIETYIKQAQADLLTRVEGIVNSINDICPDVIVVKDALKQDLDKLRGEL